MLVAFDLSFIRVVSSALRKSWVNPYNIGMEKLPVDGITTVDGLYLSYDHDSDRCVVY